MAATYSYNLAGDIYHFNKALKYDTIVKYIIRPYVYAVFADDDDWHWSKYASIVRLVTIEYPDKILVYVFVGKTRGGNVEYSIMDYYNMQEFNPNFMNTGRGAIIYHTSHTNEAMAIIADVDVTQVNFADPGAINTLFEPILLADIPEWSDTRNTVDGKPQNKNDKQLVFAARNGNISMIQELLTAGANVHTQNDLPLGLAAKNGHFEAVELLLINGADVHGDDDYALRHAATNGHDDIVKLLLMNKANVHAKNDEALRFAARDGRDIVVDLLLAAGADVHAEEDEPLRAAAYNHYAEIVKVLLANGANVNAKNGEALEWAIREEDAEIVKLLVAAGVVTNNHMFDLAAISNNHKIIELLLTYSQAQGAKYSYDIIEAYLNHPSVNPDTRQLLQDYLNETTTKGAR
jgi:ankyrin repeat protein